jgi:hypothetical protein
MPTTDFSASLTTARRKQLALYGWRLNDQYSYNPQTKNLEQVASHGARGTGPSGQTYTDVVQGGLLTGQPNNNVNPGVTNSVCPTSGCSATITLQGFVRNSPGNVRSLGGSDNS